MSYTEMSNKELDRAIEQLERERDNAQLRFENAPWSSGPRWRAEISDIDARLRKARVERARRQQEAA